MDKNYVNQLILDLYFHLPDEVHTQALEKLVNIEEEYLDMLLQPISKGYWEYAAIALKKIGYPRYKSILPGLLEWLQDMNWPATFIIIESLLEIDHKTLIPYIEDAISKALRDNDEGWLFGIKCLVKEGNIKRNTFINKKLYDIVISTWE